MADLVDYERVLLAANNTDPNNPIIAGIQTQLSRAAREESGRLADALLALMDDKS